MSFKTLNVLGIEANIGSMLYPFRQKGHHILGLSDSRNIVNNKNFQLNFPGSYLYDSVNDIESDLDVDVVVSQPACGQHSSLNNGIDCHSDHSSEKFFLKKCLDTNANFIIIENKPGYLNGLDIKSMEDKGYKVYVEWVSNYFYGNVQKPRDRVFIIATKDKDWKFIPNERVHSKTVESVLAGLPMYHDDIKLDHVHRFKKILKSYDPDTYWSREDIVNNFKSGKMFTYTKRDGTETSRPGKKLTGPTYSHTITGGDGLHHWQTGYQLTHRERLRIQGFDDNFSVKHLTDNKKSAAIGKSMPQEFLRYLVDLIDGDNTEPSNIRLAKPHPVVTNYKTNRRYNVR